MAYGIADRLRQDAHPHPVYTHAGNRILFNFHSGRYVKVYIIDVKE